VSGRKPWTAEQRRIAVGLAQDLTNTRNSAAQTLLASVLSQELTEAQAAVLLAKLRTDFNAGGAAQDLGSDQLVELTDTIGDPLDSLSDLSELSSLRLRSFMDRRAKALEAISNIFKKFAETQAKIVANLK
jgi:endonuclease III